VPCCQGAFSRGVVGKKKKKKKKKKATVCVDFLKLGEGLQRSLGEVPDRSCQGHRAGGPSVRHLVRGVLFRGDLVLGSSQGTERTRRDCSQDTGTRSLHRLAVSPPVGQPSKVWQSGRGRMEQCPQHTRRPQPGSLFGGRRRWLAAQ